MRDTRRDAFRVMARAFAILALVLCFSPVLAEDFVPPGYTLERVVILSRHGVRAPTKDNATLQAFRKPTTPSWPDFGVQHPADLTLRGAFLMQQMGVSYQKRWGNLLHPYEGQCPTSPPTLPFFWADRDERTLMTARSLVGGLLGWGYATPCNLPVQEMTFGDSTPGTDTLTGPGTSPPPSKVEVTDPIFHPTSSKATPDCRPPAAENPPVTKDQIGLVQKVVDCCSENLCKKLTPPLPSCDLQHLWDDKNRQAGNPHDQAYDFIQSFGEILLFEYAQGFTGNHFAFGNIPPAEKGGTWRDLLAIHAKLFNQRQRNLSVALPQGANLLYHMAYAIYYGAPLIPPSTKGRPSNFVVYVGHDTNIANVAALLGLEWKIGDYPPNDGYPPNDVAPGAALAFEVWQGPGFQHYVYPVMLAQPPDSLRGEGSDVSFVQLRMPGCRPDGSCEIGKFVTIVTTAIKHDENNACITDWRDWPPPR